MSHVTGKTPVSELNGCGRATTKKLNEKGVYTYDDLLKNQHLTGINNISKLISSAKSQLGSIVDVKPKHIRHNWMGLICHIIRANGKIIRGEIGELLICPYRVVLMVTWRTKNRSHSKSFSPSTLICIQKLWSTMDIVSDDSDEYSCDVLTTLLPKIQIDMDQGILKTLTETELKALSSIIKETNQLFNCIRHV
jgi:hypothetical protein